MCQVSRCYNPARDMDIKPAFFSDQPEKTLAASLTRAKRTQLGQVFTPYAIAREMAKWVTALRHPVSALDPALGLGIFLRALLENSVFSPPRMTAYEIDPVLAGQAQQLFTQKGCSQLEIHTSSYLSSSWEPQYDAILCNPPYRRFRGLPDKEELVKQIKTNTGLTISRAANLYVFFLIKAVHQLAGGGRAAFILPYEFFNADYGQVVKQYLLHEGVLRKVLILGDKIQPFEQVITTTCIVCLERTDTEYPPEMQTCRSLDELSDAITAPTGISPSLTQKLQPASEKWMVPAILHPEMDTSKLVPLSTFGRIKRGIATGDNSYFLLTESQRSSWEINVNCVLPCLAKSSLAPAHMFTTASFEKLRQADKPVWLFQAVENEQDPSVQKYVAYGIERGTDQRYLTRMRKPWYALEDRPPAPLLATTFSRGGIRWIKNDAAVRFLTAFHGFYPYPDSDLDLLAAYLITPLAQRILAQNRREYGNGLHKFEPNDLNHGLVVDIRLISSQTGNEINQVYREFIASNDQAIGENSAINRLNRIFSEYLE